MSFLATPTPGNHAGTTAPDGRHCYTICCPPRGGTPPLEVVTGVPGHLHFITFI